MRPARARSSWWLGLAALGVVAVVAAVVLSGDDDDGGDSGGTGATGIDGTAWVLDSGTGPGGPVPMIDGWPITLTFTGDTLGGVAACNSYGGSFELDGEAIAIREVAQTEMACEGPDVMSSEAAFLGALLGVDRLSATADRLVLTGPSTELEFEPAAPVPTAELVGQRWLLDTLIEGEVASTVLGDPATLLLAADGSVEGSTGCRSFTGEYAVSGSSVQFTRLEMAGECPPDLADQDSLVVTVLGDGFTAEIDGQRLLVSAQGNQSLGYTATDG